MSYSRWINSFWYTYWACPAEEYKDSRDAQRFDICGIKSYTYKELKDDLDGCIEGLKAYMKENGPKQDKKYTFVPETATDEEFEELKGYMKEFMRDVEEDEDLS
jgi:hypothetical protein